MTLDHEFFDTKALKQDSTIFGKSREQMFHQKLSFPHCRNVNYHILCHKHERQFLLIFSSNDDKTS